MNKEYYGKYRKPGQNIVYYKKDRGYTQLQFAELLDIDRNKIDAATKKCFARPYFQNMR